MADSDPWPDWIRQHQQELAERSYGHELAFVERVLRRVPEIDPSWVTHEFPFQDANGRHRRIDFVLEHWSLHRPIAIEVDGRDKTGRPPSKSEHNDFFERQNALTALDFRLLRFTNGQVSGNPVRLRREISEAVAMEQLSAQRMRATQLAESSPAIASEEPGSFAETPEPASELDRIEPDPRTSGAREAQSATKAARWLLPVLALVGAVILLLSSGSGDQVDRPPSTATELGTEPIAPFECPAAALVKGNESATSGELIYHLPDGQFYDQTNPVRCFANEADAQAAGFRASQR